MPLSPRTLEQVHARFLPEELHERVRTLAYADAGHGFDAFGANRDWVGLGLVVTRWLYERYFRVRSYGADRVPAEGATIVAANHSGTLPFDAAMLYVDILRHTTPPRMPRAVADLFVPLLPYVSTSFARFGVVAGERRNVQALLEAGELLMIFPEGTPGIGKRFSERYKLQTWREGHAELAIRHRAAVVPTAIIGPEEQMPQIARFDGVHLFGAPYLPVPLTLFPLPVRYHIHYGEPILLHERFPPESSDDPEVTREAALIVKRAVQELIDRGLEQREGVFR